MLCCEGDAIRKGLRVIAIVLRGHARFRGSSSEDSVTPLWMQTLTEIDKGNQNNKITF